MRGSMTKETIELLQKAKAEGQISIDDLIKAWTQGGAGAAGSVGLVNFDLQRPAKNLFPVHSPLRNTIPRVQGNGGISTDWKAVTDINVNRLNIGVSEGKRGRVMDTMTIEKNAKYRAIGLEDTVTFEATYADDNFDDVLAKSVTNLLSSLMVAEEQVILGGNGVTGLGQYTGTISDATVADAAATITGDVHVRIAPLTHEGFYFGQDGGNLRVRGKQALVNAAGNTEDTFGGGTGRVSAATQVATALSAGNRIDLSWEPHPRAVGYAVFWGDTASSLPLGAIVGDSTYSIYADAAGTQNHDDADLDIVANDWSVNQLVFDGYLADLTLPGSGAYYNQVAAGEKLTGDGAGIAQIDAALRWFYNVRKLSPQEIYVSPRELENITNLIVTNQNGAAYSFTLNGANPGPGGREIMAGTVVVSYLNKFTRGGAIPIMLHPTLPEGTIFFRSTSIPYANNNVPRPSEIRYRKEYYQTEWPRRERVYEYGVYADEVLVNYAPFAFGVISNLADGIAT